MVSCGYFFEELELASLYITGGTGTRAQQSAVLSSMVQNLHINISTILLLVVVVVQYLDSEVLRQSFKLEVIIECSCRRVMKLQIATK